MALTCATIEWGLFIYSTVIFTWTQCHRRFEVQVGFRAKGHKGRDALFISVGQAISDFPGGALK